MGPEEGVEMGPEPEVDLLFLVPKGPEDFFLFLLRVRAPFEMGPKIDFFFLLAMAYIFSLSEC